MPQKEFEKEYHYVVRRTLKLAKTVKEKGLPAISEMIDEEKLKKRDILEYGSEYFYISC